jgi:FkbM family methyltransferase
MGFFAIRMAKQFPRIEKVISYEALPHNVSFALENIKLNGVESRCEVVQKAISPTDEEKIDFFISTDSGKHSILKIRGRENISVPAININDAIRESGATAIKMDVEGAEYELIKAVTDWSQIRVIVVEWHFNALRALRKGKDHRTQLFGEIMQILGENFDEIRKLPNVAEGKNYITHFVAYKNDTEESV